MATVKVEVTGSKAVQTKRGPMVVQQVLLRTEKGVVLHEQWMEPQNAVAQGVYEADLDIYQGDRRAQVGFANFRVSK